MTATLRPYLCWVTLLLVGVLSAGCTKSAKKSYHLSRAARDFQAGAYDNAKIGYMKVLQDDPTTSVAFSRLGQIWLEEGAPLRATPFLKKAAELNPSDFENRVRLATVYQVVGAKAEAIKELLASLQQSPDNGKALVSLTEMASQPEEISQATKAAQDFPAKESASYQLATANLALRKKDLGAAGKAIEKALAADPKSSEAHQARGILMLFQKDPKAAGKEFKTAAEIASIRSNIRINYAQYVRQTEGGDAAAAYLKLLTAKAPDFLAAWTLLGRFALAEKKYDQALGDLENVFSRDSQNIDARLLQSDIFLGQHQPEKAITQLEKIEKLYPGLPPAKYRLAQAYMQQNKPAQAANALDQALAKNPNYTEAILAREELNVRTGHPADAITALESLLKKTPGLKAAQLLLADAYRASARPDDAANLFREQIRATPKATEPYFFLGLLDSQQGKSEEARKSFEKVLELSPDNRSAVEQLVNLDLQAKDYTSASRRVQEQLSSHPDSTFALLLEGKVRMAEANWLAAEQALKKLLTSDPNSGPAYDMLVTCYLATGRLPDAARELEVVLSKAPDNQSARMTLATIREKQKDYPKARAVYEKLLALNPKFVPALNNLSYLYSEQFNDSAKAIELAQKARSLDPANPAVADTLGWAAYKGGDYQQALTLLDESATKIGNNPEIQFHVGMAHYMMGQADAARAAFQKAVAATGDFPSKAEAQSRLALLTKESAPAGALSAGQLEAMTKRQPNDLVARLRLAEAYEKDKDWSKAADAYEAALKINPKLASAALKLARIYGGPAPNKEKALSYAKMARSLAPDDQKVTAVLGRVAFDTGNFSWSYNLLKESVRQLSSDPQVLHDLVWAAYSLGKVDEARTAMERSLAASPQPEVGNDGKRFLNLTAQEVTPDAVAPSQTEVDSALRGDPPYVPALMAAAKSDLKQANKANATKRYQQVLQRFPDFAPAQKQLALLYAEEPAHVAETFDLASKARKALPDDPVLAQLLGRLCYERRNYSRAIQLLEESQRKQQLGPSGLFYLGVSRLAANEKKSGREALNRALVAGLQEPLAAEARKALAASSEP
ncbi:MAG: tetratricopeptide repeat protein [Chthoniobacterales bacterium]